MTNEPINILMIEDSPLDAALIMEMLQKEKKFSFNLKHVSKLSTGLDCLAEGGFDLILLDLLLPDSLGVDTLDKVFAQAPDLPIIILSIVEDERLSMKAVEKGAQDYLFKGEMDGNLLVRSIGYAMMRKKAQKELEEALHEKEILLKEIHHRVKNNLQVVCSLLYLQENYFEDEKYKHFFEDTQSRIKSMALVHDQLCHSKSLSHINFAEYIKHTCGDLLHLYNPSDKIKFSMDVEDIELSIESAVPCGLILNELISNSLKHAFPGGEGGQIRLKFCRDAGRQITLLVNDNGVGFPKDLDFKKTTSLGMKIVKLLVNQLSGAIALDRAEGTTFKISFPELLSRPQGTI